MQQPLGAPALVVAPGTAGKGGPTPDPLFGWEGITSPSGGVRYVAMAGRARPWSPRPGRGRPRAPVGHGEGSLGIPLVTWDGTNDGLSADGQRLVLASITCRAARRPTTFVVLGRTRWSSAPDRALRPLGVRRPLAERVDDLRAPVRRPGSGHYRFARSTPSRGSVVRGAIVDQREPDEDMLGSPMTRAWSADRAWAYTLYAKPNGTAFVHGLDTSNVRGALPRPALEELGDGSPRSGCR